MSRISNTFERLKSERKNALVTYVMAGDPDIHATENILPALVSGGADIIEVGMPFSDPMADGPVIQAAGLRSLDAGTKLSDIFALIKSFRKQNDSTPIVLMGYANNVYSHGLDNFIEHCISAGVDGLLIVDLPPEEAAPLAEKLTPHGIDLIRLIAPTTKGERLKEVLKSCSGFIYYVAVAGITGGKTADVDAIKPHVKQINELSDLPLCIGFGIKTADDVKRFATLADGCVVGSALVDAVHESNGDQAEAAKEFVQNLSVLS